MASRSLSRRSPTTGPLVCDNPPRVGRNATCVSLSLPVLPKCLACHVCTPKLDGTAVRKPRKNNKMKAKQNLCRQPWHEYWRTHRNKIYAKFYNEVRYYLCLPIDETPVDKLRYEEHHLPLSLIDDTDIVTIEPLDSKEVSKVNI